MLAICKILLINHLPIMDGEGLQFFLFFLRVSQALSMMMMMLHYAPTDYLSNRDAAWQVNFAITSRFFSSSLLSSAAAITDYFVMCACENDRLNGQVRKSGKRESEKVIFEVFLQFFAMNT